MNNELFNLENGILTIKDGIEIVPEGPFQNLKFHTLNLSNSVSEIKGFAFYNNDIEKICFNDNLKIIGNQAFKNNKIEELNLPNSIKKIGNQAFKDNKIKILTLPKTIKEIEYKCFENNNIEILNIPNNIKEIKEEAFYNNNIQILNIEEGIKTIGKNAFSKNRIDNLILPDTIIEIDENAFMQSGIKKLKLPRNLKEIKKETFKYNGIETLELNEFLEIIGNQAFEENRIKELFINNNLNTIEEYAFYKNKLINLNLDDNIKRIKEGAFKRNELEKISLSKNQKIVEKAVFMNNNIKKINNLEYIEKIESDAFCSNDLTNIEITNNIKQIDNNAFYGNPLLEVKIQNKDIKLGTNVFKPVNLIIEEKLYDNEFLEKYNTNNIIKIIKINELFKNFNFSIIEPNELDNMPVTRENINAFKNNYKIYNELYNYAINNYPHTKLVSKKTKEYKSFFNLCFISGLFSTGGEELKKSVYLIEKMIKKHEEKELLDIFMETNELKYDLKFRDLLIEYVNDPNYEQYYKFLNITYENFIDIKKSIKRQKKHELSKLHADYITTNNIELKNKIEMKKKNIKEIKLTDIKKYHSDHIFNIRPNNKDLEDITLLLSSYINQKEFNRIQDIYEQYNEEEEYKYFKEVYDKIQNKNNYLWSNGNNPINFALGYIVNCCAKLNEKAEDVMIQSVINPKIKNIIIYDKMKKIIGKTTAFYNPDGKYILCNNIVMSNRFRESKKTTIEDEIDALDAIIRALTDQMNEMNKHGIEVNEIRIGMRISDLIKAIEIKKLKIIKNDLLKNYNYNNFEGDANDKMYGQVIIKT